MTTNKIKLCFLCPEKLGYNFDELENLDFSEFEKMIHPEDINRLLGELDKINKGISENFQCDIRIKLKNQSWLWFSMRGGVIESDKDQKPLLLAGVNIDINWRKEVEKKILHYRNILQQIIDGLPFPVWLVNRERKILFQNKRAETILETKVGEYCWNTLHKGLTLPDEQRKIFFERGEIPKDAKCHYCRADEALDSKSAVNDTVELYGRVWDSWWVYIDEDLFCTTQSMLQIR